MIIYLRYVTINGCTNSRFTQYHKRVEFVYVFCILISLAIFSVPLMFFVTKSCKMHSIQLFGLVEFPSINSPKNV